MEYAEFKLRYNAEEFNIGVVPVVARKFFTDSSRAQAEKVLGERLFGQFVLVKGCLMSFWLLLLVSMVCWGLAIHWWSLIAIPITFFIYAFNLGMAARSYQAKVRSFIFLVACIAIALLWLSDYLWFQVLIVAYPLSILSLKMMYSFAVTYLRDLIVGNPKMYDKFKDELLLQDNTTGIKYRSKELQQ